MEQVKELLIAVVQAIPWGEVFTAATLAVLYFVHSLVGAKERKIMDTAIESVLYVEKLVRDGKLDDAGSRERKQKALDKFREIWTSEGRKITAALEAKASGTIERAKAELAK